MVAQLLPRLHAAVGRRGAALLHFTPLSYVNQPYTGPPRSDASASIGGRRLCHRSAVEPQQPPFESDHHGCRAVVDTELGEDVHEV